MFSLDVSNHDVLVMGTSKDAVKAKHAAVAAGYYRDLYIQAFAPPQPSSGPPVQVIIKRGTFARAACIYKAVVLFLRENNDTAQVIVLGSGKDTLFFRILDDLRDHGSVCTLKWSEVDFGRVLKEKMLDLQSNPKVFGVNVINSPMDRDIFDVRQSADDASRRPWPKNMVCNLIAHDLQQDPERLFREKLIRQSGMNPKAPTLVVMECVQMYLSVDAVSKLLKCLTTNFIDTTLVSYEPILGAISTNNAFGLMMQENLTKAGVVRPDSCLIRTRTLGDTLSQLRQSGFARATGCDMYAAYETVLSVDQRAGAQRCEFLDELEEFILIMRHYCLVVANNNLESNTGRSMCAVGDGARRTLMGFVKGRCQQL